MKHEFVVNCLIAKDGDQYAALCYEYNVATCAPTPEEALDDLMRATVDYLETFLGKGAKPQTRPASQELLFEFLGLDPEQAQYSKEEISRALGLVIPVRLTRTRCPVYSVSKGNFEQPLEPALSRLGTGAYPVTIAYA